jgi:molecular chaperone GrpE
MASADDTAEGKGFRVNDQRWWLRDDADSELPTDAGLQAKPSYIEELEEQLAESGRRLQATLAAHREVKAELENVRLRLEREQALLLEVERARLASPFLDVVDNLKRMLTSGAEQPTVDSICQGAELLLRQLEERLEELGLVAIEAAGQAFDPNTMEALMTSEVAPEQEGRVLEVVRPGYLLGERVVRPAGVRVGVAKRG